MTPETSGIDIRKMLHKITPFTDKLVIYHRRKAWCSARDTLLNIPLFQVDKKPVALKTNKHTNAGHVRTAGLDITG